MFNKEQVKNIFLNNFQNLFCRGEILKAEKLVNYCIPLELENDPIILEVKNQVNKRVNEIREWNIEGRPTPQTYANITDPLSFPKFKLTYDKIKEREAKVILDVGCYTADFLNLLAKEKYECYGIDIHKDLMEKLDKEYNGSPKFTFSRIERLPQLWSNKFDVVISLDVLEHCLNIYTAISSIEEVIKEGGLIIINLPILEEFYTDESYEHLRMFSESHINKLFGNKKNYKLENSYDEIGRKTNFITYEK